MLAFKRTTAVGRVVNYVTHVNDVDDFYPKFPQDFDAQKKDYSVKWQGSFVGPQSRFPAEIVVLGGEFASRSKGF